MNTIGFPNLGIAPFDVDPTALSLGPIRVQWYGVIIVLGMILGAIYAYYRLREKGMNADNVSDIVLVCVPCGIVGARAYYVLTTLNVYEYRSLYDVVAVWEGGLAVFGGILAGMAGLLVVCRVKKYPTLAVFDAMSCGVLIGQILGRWGNFMNAEAYGVTDSFEFLGHFFPLSGQETGNPLIMTVNGVYAQPTFLYESVWNLIGFIGLHFFWKHKKYDGQILLLYGAWYGLGRALIEGLRADSLYVGSLRVSQCLAFGVFVVCVVLLVVFSIKKRAAKQTI